MLRTLNVLFFTVFTVLCSFGQKGTHTPYSSFGLGELKGNDYAAFSSMGGVSMACSDSTIINQQNPASFVHIARHQPIFQIGLDGRFSKFETETNSTNQKFFGLNQFQLGIPIKKNWGAAFGIKPYSFTGYQISNYVVEDGDSIKLFTNEGHGGINDFYLGVAYKPLHYGKDTVITKTLKDTTGKEVEYQVAISRKHNLSIGANANYLFGSSTKINTFQYWNSALGLNSKVDNSLRFSGLTYDFGINYEFGFGSQVLNTKKQSYHSIAIGATYSPRIAVRAYQDLLTYSYITIGGGFNGPELISDTVDFINENQGNVVVPESYKFGIEYRVGPRSSVQNSQLRIGADVRYQKWSAYDEKFGSTAYTNNMKDRMNISVGMEWLPTTKARSYMSKVKYRLGGNYTITELNVLNNLGNYTNLSAYGMSFGVGLPITIIKSSNTNINFGANLGRLGTTDNGLIRENYVGVFFGLSITPGYMDQWFIKRKYD
ncbi:MAG: hypothetical protein R2780_10400 [Crocinitomicaceae bacterium]|nr:hypothetical protein [Crocinitomicaceae bacterium]